jgi:hypothetical protein
MATVNGLTDITYSPNMDFCGETDVFSYEVCDNVGCDTAEVSVAVICPSLYPQYTIELVTADDDGDTVPDSLEASCELRGIVHGVNLRGSEGLLFTLIDENDLEDGIAVFNPSEDFGYTVEEGDVVIVRGEIDQFNGLTQIFAEELQEVGSASIYTPEVVTALDESTESKLVRINNLFLVDPADWDDSGSSFNIDVTDGTNTYTMRIDSDTEIAGTGLPPVQFALIGIGGQFDANAPFDEGYQLIPRYLDDIIPLLNTRNVDLSASITFGPNPVSDNLSIQSEIEVDRYEVRNLLGQPMLSDQPNTRNWTISTAGWARGIYTLTFFTEEGGWTTTVVKQ